MTTTLRALLLLSVFAALPAAAQPGSDEEARWRAEAADTSIVRDDWGIAHIHGKTDADTVFGMIYAQAEDDFNRVETNYLNAMGRLAEAEGESAIYQDLRMKLFIRPEELKTHYAASPAPLQKLMQAWADGLNLYLHSHPQVTPRVLHRFEPWMALSFTEGSIGGDIERVALNPLRALYAARTARTPAGDGGPRSAEVRLPIADLLPRQLLFSSPADRQGLGAGPWRRVASRLDPADSDNEPGGSNGIAIAPANTVNHHALLLINPHTSFFFRSELQVTSDEGLNAYGAVTWGQFFIYQGFNERLGWMHTSSGVDNVDFFAETVVNKNGRLFYRFGSELRPVTVSTVNVAYRTADGGMATKSFTTYATHHGPIIDQINGKWIAIALMQKPIEALSQGFGLTKARDFASFMKVMELRANSSNNTIYADADGSIAYLHPQFVPRRDDHFDYTRPVDGANPATDWKGLHALAELPRLLNPASGWIMNTNDWPYSAAGSSSPKREDYPRYMDTAGENPRGVHATLVLKDRKDFSPDALNAAAFDSYLPAFAQLIPALTAAYDTVDDSNALKAKLADQIALLRGWNYRWGLHSVATTLAALWGDELWNEAKSDADAEKLSVYDDMADRTTAVQKLSVLARVSDRLEQDFGTWRVQWGEMNRCQRLTSDIVQKFNDAAPSIPVEFTSARWGSLASYGARRYEGTSKYYGTNGNSFVAIVEFGERVSARAITMGGESSDPKSPHFNDQASRYADGSLREVYFYPAQLVHHTEREYHPN
jgi:acyl-homoserine-lactone acylase